MNDRDVLSVLHYPVDRIGYSKHKTRGKLSFRFACINETRRVWNELAVQHDLGHPVVKHPLFFRIGLGARHVSDHAADDVGPCLDGLAVLIF